ncbi:hypothetical protein IPA_09300 [Ignicoccus pacificus DSM 13166]|uniref:Uncharacterized protein n=1 Tax=Ignicoccus pacificus DSM 13166 TaxID=940294 RepID=A0A977KA66_9CREN|nr:hypothetical protein IPA_09300 [Ignicoccus pacificus DSM 13166]
MSEETGIRLVVKIGEGENAKEVELTEEVLRVVRKYLHTEYSLEKLAEDLGLDGWEEAYEFVKKMPAWLVWTPPTLLRYKMRMLEEKIKSGQLVIE